MTWSRRPFRKQRHRRPVLEAAAAALIGGDGVDGYLFLNYGGATAS